jgi:type II secretory pathway pseudopilin PulG
MTLVETVVSVAVVSVLLAGALNATGASAAGRRLSEERRTAEKLCDDLMAEAMSRPYLDPDNGNNGEGPAPEEASTSVRTAFDDVDDFNGWKASPPLTRDGKAISGTTGLTRGITVVKYPGATDMYKYAGEVKVVTVTVWRGGRELASRTAIRVPAWDMKDRED